MTRILAIEPDPQRGATLRRLLRERLAADIVVATSTEAAIARMGEKPPTLILTSSLIGPSDDQHLAAHLRQANDLRHVPILTVPFLLDGNEGNAGKGLVSRLLHRRQRRVPLYDFGAVAGRIEDAIEQSKKEAALDANGYLRPVLVDACAPPLSVDAPGPLARITDRELQSYLLTKKRRPPRLTPVELPWLSGIRLTWGPEMRLLNISRSGLLVESGIRLTPGSKTAFELAGPVKDLIVPARVIRTRVSSVDPLGVTYQAAAAFEQPFDSLLPGDGSLESPDPAECLAELVARVEEGAARGAHPVDLRTEFEAGIQELVTARDVRLREAPIAENDGRDSVYFTVPTRDSSTAVLQATFEPGYQPTADEFDALRAAAVAAADILQFTEPARQLCLTSAPEARIGRIALTSATIATSALELRRTA